MRIRILYNRVNKIYLHTENEMTEATTIAYKLITRVYKGVNRIYSEMLYQNGSFCEHRKTTIHHLMLLLLNPSYFNLTQRLGLDSYCSGCSIAWNIFQFKSVKDYAKNSICIMVGILLRCYFVFEFTLEKSPTTDSNEIASVRRNERNMQFNGKSWRITPCR